MRSLVALRRMPLGLAFAALGLLPRLLLAPGVVPSVAGPGFAVEICRGVGPIAADTRVPVDRDPDERGSAACVFAALASLAIGAVPALTTPITTIWFPVPATAVPPDMVTLRRHGTASARGPPGSDAPIA